MRDHIEDGDQLREDVEDIGRNGSSSVDVGVCVGSGVAVGVEV
jgi:hypothetical protein